MRGWDWSVARAYLPTALALGIAFATSLMAPSAQAGSSGVTLDAARVWLPYALFVLAVLLGGWVTIRLWRVRQATSLICHCGGLLGPERPLGLKHLRARVCRDCGRQWRRRA